jgi:hypothetical protein
VEWWRNGTAQLLIRHRLDEFVKPLTLFKLVIGGCRPRTSKTATTHFRPLARNRWCRVALFAFGHNVVGDGTMAVRGLDGTGQQYPWLEAQLQATLNLIPAHTWYALPSGALTFLNERCADYLGLPKNHPLRFGIDTGASWDSHTLRRSNEQKRTSAKAKRTWRKRRG